MSPPGASRVRQWVWARIKSVLNPVAASGGIGAPPRSALRDLIPTGAQDLGRIVTRQDMVTFVLNRPEVSAAVLTVAQGDGTLPRGRHSVFLLTLAAPDNAVPDMASPAFKSLSAAVDAAQATRLDIRLLPFEPLPFKVQGWFTAATGADIHAIQQSISDALRAAYALPAMAFDEPVRASEIIRIVEGVNAVTESRCRQALGPHRIGRLLRRAGPAGAGTQARPARSGDGRADPVHQRRCRRGDLHRADGGQAMSDDTEGAPIPDALYDLLPPIFRMADITQGYPAARVVQGLRPCARADRRFGPRA